MARFLLRFLQWSFISGLVALVLTCLVLAGCASTDTSTWHPQPPQVQGGGCFGPLVYVAIVGCKPLSAQDPEVQRQKLTCPRAQQIFQDWNHEWMCDPRGSR